MKKSRLISACIISTALYLSSNYSPKRDLFICTGNIIVLYIFFLKDDSSTSLPLVGKNF